MAGIWGKIIGGAAGFAVGGPLGALVGAVAGHAVDRMRSSQAEEGGGDQTRETAFTIAVVALSAKMAKADGHVTRDEVDVFKRIFQIPPEEMTNVGRIFDLARKSASGFEPYARQVARMFKSNPAVLEELLDALFMIARADQVMHPAEISFLREVASIFGFDDAAFERIRAGHAGAETANPYTVLGVTSDASDDDVRAAWRKLIRENHPDTLIAQGMPEDFIAVATEKMAVINASWDQICEQRGLK
jgi:DnaJ like chaperone protein